MGGWKGEGDNLQLLRRWTCVMEEYNSTCETSGSGRRLARRNGWVSGDWLVVEGGGRGLAETEIGGDLGEIGKGTKRQA